MNQLAAAVPEPPARARSRTTTALAGDGRGPAAADTGSPSRTDTLHGLARSTARARSRTSSAIRAGVGRRQHRRRRRTATRSGSPPPAELSGTAVLLSSRACSRARRCSARRARLDQRLGGRRRRAAARADLPQPGRRRDRARRPGGDAASASRWSCRGQTASRSRRRRCATRSRRRSRPRPGCRREHRPARPARPPRVPDGRHRAGAVRRRGRARGPAVAVGRAGDRRRTSRPSSVAARRRWAGPCCRRSPRSTAAPAVQPPSAYLMLRAARSIPAWAVRLLVLALILAGAGRDDRRPRARAPTGPLDPPLDRRGCSAAALPFALAALVVIGGAAGRA